VATVATEVALKNVDHRPEVSALLDVHLEEVAKIIERRAGVAQTPLLLDRRGLCVGLRDDDAAQWVSELAGHFLVSVRAKVVAEADARVRVGGLEEDAPAVLGHPHIVEVSPPFRLDA